MLPEETLVFLETFAFNKNCLHPPDHQYIVKSLKLTSDRGEETAIVYFFNSSFVYECMGGDEWLSVYVVLKIYV